MKISAHRALAVFVLIVSTGILGLTFCAQAAAPAKTEAAAPAPKPANGVIEITPEGRVLWGGDHDAVAKVLVNTIQGYDVQLKKQQIVNDLLLEEVARLRSERR